MHKYIAYKLPYIYIYITHLELWRNYQSTNLFFDMEIYLLNHGIYKVVAF
jgi:hypothetical protein